MPAFPSPIRPLSPGLHRTVMLRHLCRASVLLGLVIGQLLMAAPASGQPEPFAMLPSHEVPMGTLEAVAISGPRVYVGLGPRLGVLDISDPQSPAMLGASRVLGDVVRDISPDPIQPDHVFVAAGSTGTVVFDTATPSRPAEIRRVDGRSVAVQVTDAHVFILGDALRIFLREAGALREVGRIELPIEAFHVVESIAWLATGPAGVVAYDISDPARPTPVGALDTAGDSHDIRVADSTAYVADGGLRLSVLDVSDPATPTLASEYLLDVSDESQCPSAGSNCGLDVRRVRLAGDRVVVSAYRTLGAFSGRTRPRVVLLDASLPTSPSRLGLVKLGANPVAIAADDTHVVVAKRPLWWYAGVSPCQLVQGGLDVYDADLGLLGTFDAPAGANAVALFDDKAWLADVTRGVRAYDLAAPGAPLPVPVTGRRYGAWYGSWEARDIVVDDEGARLAYGGQTAGFLVAGAGGAGGPFGRGGQLEAPHPLARPTPGRMCNGCAPPPGDQWYRRIASDGTRDYLLDLAAGLQVFELAEGGASGRLATVNALDLAAKDGVAYLAGPEGLTAVDAGDPTTPRPVGDLRLTGFGNAVAVSDGASLVAMAGPRGLALVDVRPADPVALGTTATPTEGRDVAIHGHTAYVATGDALHAFDVADPASPVEVARARGLRDAHAVATDGVRVAVLAAGGLLVFDALPDDGSPPRLPDVPDGGFGLYLPLLTRAGG